jgi:hypothetical protein
MRVQPHDAPVAIHKRMDPAQALVGAGQRHQRGLATANPAIKSAPTRQKHRHAGMRWRHMLSDPHVSLAQRARQNRFFLGGEQITRRQMTQQRPVNILHRVHGVQSARAFSSTVALLQRLLSRDVGHSQTLLGGQRGVF